MGKNNENSENDLDWEHRILCSDENCIGIIGMDGKCRECGKIFDGKLPENFGVNPEEEKIEPDIENLNGERLLDKEAATENHAQEENDELDMLDPDWEQRILCNDGNCIGVIGPDGKCKECGKPYEETDQQTETK